MGSNDYGILIKIIYKEKFTMTWYKIYTVINDL